MKRRKLLRSGLALSVGLVAGMSNRSAWANSSMFPVTKTEQEWRELLTPQQYAVLREEATERPFANAYFNNKEDGIYHCAGCETAVFSSETKYVSGTGWPSFWEPVSESAIGTKTDWKLVLPRTEVHCATCGGHLGHVFNDGPQPTGLRYCLNSAALNFVAA